MDKKRITGPLLLSMLSFSTRGIILVLAPDLFKLLPMSCITCHLFTLVQTLLGLEVFLLSPALLLLDAKALLGPFILDLQPLKLICVQHKRAKR